MFWELTSFTFLLLELIYIFVKYDLYKTERLAQYLKN